MNRKVGLSQRRPIEVAHCGEPYSATRCYRLSIPRLNANRNELTLLGVLQGSFIFLADLSRAIPRPHALDFVVLAGYDGALGGRTKIRLIKDLDLPITNRLAESIICLPVYPDSDAGERAELGAAVRAAVDESL